MKQYKGTIENPASCATPDAAFTQLEKDSTRGPIGPALLIFLQENMPKSYSLDTIECITADILKSFISTQVPGLTDSKTNRIFHNLCCCLNQGVFASASLLSWSADGKIQTRINPLISKAIQQQYPYATGGFQTTDDLSASFNPTNFSPTLTIIKGEDNPYLQISFSIQLTRILIDPTKAKHLDPFGKLVENDYRKQIEINPKDVSNLPLVTAQMKIEIPLHDESLNKFTCKFEVPKWPKLETRIWKNPHKKQEIKAYIKKALFTQNINLLAILYKGNIKATPSEKLSRAYKLYGLNIIPCQKRESQIIFLTLAGLLYQKDYKEVRELLAVIPSKGKIVLNDYMWKQLLSETHAEAYPFPTDSDGTSGGAASTTNTQRPFQLDWLSSDSQKAYTVFFMARHLLNASSQAETWHLLHWIDHTRYHHKNKFIQCVQTKSAYKPDPDVAQPAVQELATLEAELGEQLFNRLLQYLPEKDQRTQIINWSQKFRSLNDRPSLLRLLLTSSQVKGLTIAPEYVEEGGAASGEAEISPLTSRTPFVTRPSKETNCQALKQESQPEGRFSKLFFKHQEGLTISVDDTDYAAITEASYTVDDDCTNVTVTLEEDKTTFQATALSLEALIGLERVSVDSSTNRGICSPKELATYLRRYLPTINSDLEITNEGVMTRLFSHYNITDTSIIDYFITRLNTEIKNPMSDAATSDLLTEATCLQLPPQGLSTKTVRYGGGGGGTTTDLCRRYPREGDGAAATIDESQLLGLNHSQIWILVNLFIKAGGNVERDLCNTVRSVQQEITSYYGSQDPPSPQDDLEKIQDFISEYQYELMLLSSLYHEKYDLAAQAISETDNINTLVKLKQISHHILYYHSNTLTRSSYDKLFGCIQHIPSEDCFDDFKKFIQIQAFITRTRYDKSESILKELRSSQEPRRSSGGAATKEKEPPPSHLCRIAQLFIAYITTEEYGDAHRTLTTIPKTDKQTFLEIMKATHEQLLGLYKSMPNVSDHTMLKKINSIIIAIGSLLQTSDDSTSIETWLALMEPHQIKTIDQATLFDNVRASSTPADPAPTLQLYQYIKKRKQEENISTLPILLTTLCVPATTDDVEARMKKDAQTLLFILLLEEKQYASAQLMLSTSITTEGQHTFPHISIKQIRPVTEALQDYFENPNRSEAGSVDACGLRKINQQQFPELYRAFLITQLVCNEAVSGARKRSDVDRLPLVIILLDMLECEKQGVRRPTVDQNLLFTHLILSEKYQEACALLDNIDLPTITVNLDKLNTDSTKHLLSYSHEAYSTWSLFINPNPRQQYAALQDSDKFRIKTLHHSLRTIPYKKLFPIFGKSRQFWKHHQAAILDDLAGDFPHGDWPELTIQTQHTIHRFIPHENIRILTSSSYNSLLLSFYKKFLRSNMHEILSPHSLSVTILNFLFPATVLHFVNLDQTCLMNSTPMTTILGIIMLYENTRRSTKTVRLISSQHDQIAHVEELTVNSPSL